MKTVRLNKNDIPEAAKLLREGKLVAFPTETVYGLGANALDKKAVSKIFKAKKRPADNPLIVHVFSVKEVDRLVLEVPAPAKKLMKKFWPGPCSILFRKKKVIPDITTAGLNTVVIRMPSNKIARELIKKAGVPIAAPSANSSGKPSPTTSAHVLEDMEGRIDAVLNGGSCTKGLESTVVDVRARTPIILRLGSLSVNEIEKVIGPVKVASKLSKAYSPGMKYRHYAPEGKLILVEGGRKTVDKKIEEMRKRYKSVTVLKRSDLQPNKLFARMRKVKTRAILCPSVPEKGLGRTVMDRLRRAATKIIVIK